MSFGFKQTNIFKIIFLSPIRFLEFGFLLYVVSFFSFQLYLSLGVLVY